MHICVVEERKTVHADSGLLSCVNHSRSVPTTITGQEEHDMSVTGRLFGKEAKRVLTNHSHKPNKIQPESMHAHVLPHKQ